MRVYFDGGSCRVMALGSKNAVFISASLITIFGMVLQDVVADAMSVEVVDRGGSVLNVLLRLELSIF